MSPARWRVPGVILATAVIAVLGAACGGSSGGPLAAVEPIENVLVGEIAVADISATGALVRVDTRIPVVCSVVFGTDETYGAQSTDPDMAGLPHTDHSAPLRGLQPDTVYHFRLQGTGSDGTLYVSDDMTFRTLPAAASAGDMGPNLASMSAGARVVEASSYFGGSPMWRPENAIDEDPRTEWSSAGDGDSAFITIELARETQLNAVGIWTRTMGASGQITRIRIVTDRDEVLGPFDVPDARMMHTFPVMATALTVRFEVVASTGGNTGAVDLAVYGEPVEPR